MVDWNVKQGASTDLSLILELWNQEAEAYIWSKCCTIFYHPRVISLSYCSRGSSTLRSSLCVGRNMDCSRLEGFMCSTLHSISIKPPLDTLCSFWVEWLISCVERVVCLVMLQGGMRRILRVNFSKRFTDLSAFTLLLLPAKLWHFLPMWLGVVAWYHVDYVDSISSVVWEQQWRR